MALVNATGQSVYRFLKAMVRDDDIAQDLTQDTYLRAFQSLGSFRGEARLTTWILAIARNLALNRVRRITLERRWHVDTGTPPDVPDERPAPEHEDERRLMAALGELSPRLREAVVLYYVEGLGIDEVAQLTRRPANTIKSDLHRARAALRIALGVPGGPPTPGPRQTETNDE